MSAATVRKSAFGRMGVRWRVAGAVALMLLLALGAELALRVAGSGHDTAYLHRVDVQGSERLRDEPGFGVLFFPEHLRPRALPFDVPADKPAGELRIVLLGGAEVMGMPEPAYGVGPMLREHLAARYPGRAIEVLVLAHAAGNSHVMRRVASELGPLRPDAIVVALGNDEVTGPYGAGTVFTERAPASARIAWNTWWRGLRLGQWWAGATGDDARPTRWRGAEMFASTPVRSDDPALERTREHFAANLDAIAAAGDALGVPVVFTTLGANLRHCAPFGSIDPSTLDEEPRGRFDRAYRTGDELWERGAADSARTSYRDALALLPNHADLHYRLGRLELAAGDTAAAVAHLRDAREHDTVRLRVDAGMNGVVRRIATRHDHVVLADLEAALAALSPAGLPGRETFLDHVHLDFAGNRIAARVLAEAIEIALRAQLGEPTAQVWPDANEIATRLAYTPYGRREVLTSVLTQFQRPPFSTQSDHLEQVDGLVRQLDALGPTQEPAQLVAMWPMVEASMQARPHDWIRRFRAAAYLAEAMDEPGRAETLWREVAERLPHFAAATNGWARAVAAQGRFPQAVRLFERSIEIDPHQHETRLQLAEGMRRTGPNDPQLRERAFEIEEAAMLVDDSTASRERLRALYEQEVQWWTERGDLARVRILRTKLDRIGAD